MCLQAEINLLLQSLPGLLAHHREAEAAPHATEDAAEPAAKITTPELPQQETPAEGRHKSVISRLAQARRLPPCCSLIARIQMLCAALDACFSPFWCMSSASMHAMLVMGAMMHCTA